ncbi:unnamed protein product [Owenia fusiformis]|uniref:Uncharacterized protein n=1 Tax=Owenia fusiformis TaxID=6347 RepID=A0A8J1XYT8_OWEFU|nr:unnamed protein product [Owenia fusiformis]
MDPRYGGRPNPYGFPPGGPQYRGHPNYPPDQGRDPNYGPDPRYGQGPQYGSDSHYNRGPPMQLPPGIHRLPDERGYRDDPRGYPDERGQYPPGRDPHDRERGRHSQDRGPHQYQQGPPSPRGKRRSYQEGPPAPMGQQHPVHQGPSSPRVKQSSYHGPPAPMVQGPPSPGNHPGKPIELSDVRPDELEPDYGETNRGYEHDDPRSPTARAIGGGAAVLGGVDESPPREHTQHYSKHKGKSKSRVRSQEMNNNANQEMTKDKMLLSHLPSHHERSGGTLRRRKTHMHAPIEVMTSKGPEIELPSRDRRSTNAAVSAATAKGVHALADQTRSVETFQHMVH